MAFEALEFTKSWTNAADFPTYEPDEAQVRADLQLLHEETRAGFNRLVAALNDPNAAASLPFAPQAGLAAETVQDAVLEVYAAIQQAAAGLLVDGSVTKEKLAADLLKRTYGGRVWVSMDTPGAGQSPDSGFPIGQLWLRPSFSVENLALQDWVLTGCTAQAGDGGWVLTADGSLAAISAAQTLTAVGQGGQRVLVSLAASELDEHLSQLHLFCNGVEQDLMDGGGMFETALDQTGSLELVVRGQWPYAEEGASLRLDRLAVVNADGAEAELTDCAGLTDWPGLVETLIPFETVRLPRQVFLQTAPGKWDQVDHEVLPVSRGGTGLQEAAAGQLLCGTGGQALTAVETGEDGGFLQQQDGMPRWVSREQLVADTGALRAVSGTYTGDGVSGRIVELPVTPRLLQLFPENGSAEAITLANGARSTGSYSISVDGGYTYYSAYVVLEGSSLKFVCDGKSSSMLATPTTRHGNASGVAYRWVALYGGDGE